MNHSNAVDVNLPLPALLSLSQQGDSLKRPPAWRRLPAALLLAPLCWLLAPAALAQQTLVGNIGNSVGNTQTTEYATAFNTGAGASAYTVTQVEMRLETYLNSRAGIPSVAIREADGGQPGNLVARLANPGNLTNQAIRNFIFTAPGGTVLAAGTTYFLVWNDGHAGRADNRGVNGTASGAETGQPGWSIGNGGLSRAMPGGVWTTAANPILFRVTGGPLNVSTSAVGDAQPIHPGGDIFGCLMGGHAPRGYCDAMWNRKPAAYIENEDGARDLIDRHVLNMACGKTGSFRIRTMNWRFAGVPNPGVWVVATTGVNRGDPSAPLRDPANDRSAPYLAVGDAKVRLDGDIGLRFPIAPHDGERVVEVAFAVDADTPVYFGFQLLASQDPAQNYELLDSTRSYSSYNYEPQNLMSEYGPIISVYMKNPAEACPSESTSTSEASTDSTDTGSPSVPQIGPPPDAVVYGHGQPSDGNNDYAADLLAAVRGYAAETDEGDEHVTRWRRVLAAFGDDNGHTPMTASEARGYADRGWTRWDPVADALAKIEAARAAAEAEPEPEPDPTPEANPEPVTEPQSEPEADPVPETNPEPQPEPEADPEPVVEPVAPIAPTSQALIAEVRRYHESNKDNQSRNFGSNWLRVLIAFGDRSDSEYTPFTVAEAKKGEAVWDGWTPVREELERLNADVDCVAAQLETNVNRYAKETEHGEIHQDRWRKVLNAFSGQTPKATLGDATAWRDSLNAARWAPVVSALRCLEAN